VRSPRTDTDHLRTDPCSSDPGLPAIPRAEARAGVSTVLPAVSGIAAVAGTHPDTAVLLERMRPGLQRRGCDHFQAWTGSEAALSVSCHDWELDSAFSGTVLVAEDDLAVVAADASLYRRDALRAELTRAGTRPRSVAPAELILAAYRCWGADCVSHLGGDFAFVVWEKSARRLFSARDVVGSRPLYYSELPGGIAVSSSIRALLGHPDVPADLDLVAIANTVGGLFGTVDETCYSAVSMLAAGSTLMWTAGRLTVRRYWQPRREPELARLSFQDAAVELRERIGDAVAARMDAATRPTSVWLSGGHDSSAIFAAGEMRLKRGGTGEHLHAVSVSYPPGDPGREDELIQKAVDRWGSPLRWIDIGSIPLLADMEKHAAERDEPFAHAFEMWNRALAAGTRSEGSRVAFSGYGGDALFKVSPVYLADLLLRGRFGEVLGEGRAMGFGRSNYRSYFTWAVKPWLPLPLLRAADSVRSGRGVHGYLERRPPPWLLPFDRRHRLLRREQRSAPGRPPGTSHADHELLWYLLYGFAPRVYSAVHSFGLESGVDLRAPLLDDRIISFALSRPVTDRAGKGERKRILRAAVRELLPDDLVESRRKTGTTGQYFDRSVRQENAGFVRDVLLDPVLAEFGIVDRDVLRTFTNRYLEGREPGAAFHLYLTFQAELWLRARMEKFGIRGRSSAPIAATVSAGA
jgi:asparagine synthase (glutamine-hydrolysing)